MKSVVPRRVSLAASFLMALALLLAGCGRGEGVVGAGSNAPAAATVEGGVEGFTTGVLKEEGYWYSRYNLGHLMMRAGMGEPFMPPMPLVMAMVNLATGTDPTSAATPPTNPALIQRPYTSGDPRWVNAPSPNPGDDDFLDNRWDPASFDTVTSEAAGGWTMIKAVEWAKEFHLDFRFGTPTFTNVIPGAQQRFGGLVLFAEAVMMAENWLANNGDPLFYDTSDVGNRYVMLWAISDLAGLIKAPVVPQSTTHRYRMAVEMMAGMLGCAPGCVTADDIGDYYVSEADNLFAVLPAPTTLRDISLAIQALVWYASIRPSQQAALVAQIISLADSILSVPLATPTATDKGYAIRALIEANRVSGINGYLIAAASTFDALDAEFDSVHGVYTSQNLYTTNDIGVILGALNSLRLFADGSVDQARVDLHRRAFFEGAIDLSGLQISAPPVMALPTFEQLPDLFHRYPSMPVPPMAGGTNGIAPVFAQSVTWDGATNTWSRDDSLFNTGGAMHLSNEILWGHDTEVNGFPELP